MPADESYPDDLRYHREHDWARIDGDIATFGITWYAQDSLGDLVVYLSARGRGQRDGRCRVRRAGVRQGRVRRSSPRSRARSPEVNQAVIDSPELVNDDPYGEGWLIRVRLSNPGELEDLLDAAAYATHLRGL